MSESMTKLGRNMSIKIRFLHSHTDLFLKNVRNIIDEEGERFHQRIKEMRKVYQGRENGNILADYCYILQSKRKSDREYSKLKKEEFQPARKKIKNLPPDSNKKW